MPEPGDEDEPLSRASLAQRALKVLRAPTSVRPAIILSSGRGGLVVVKDFSRSPWLVRQTYGRWLVGREARIYARLGNVDGVPAFRGRLDAFAFAVDYVEGQTLKAMPRRKIPAAAFDRLARLFEEVHARGVVHLDSHQKTNVLVSPDGRPWLLDFATALYLGSGWLGQRVLMPLFRHADVSGVLKLKARYRPEALTACEKRRLRRAAFLAWLWPPTVVRRTVRALRGRRRRRTRDDGGAATKP